MPGEPWCLPALQIKRIHLLICSVSICPLNWDWLLAVQTDTREIWLRTRISLYIYPTDTAWQVCWGQGVKLMWHDVRWPTIVRQKLKRKFFQTGIPYVIFISLGFEQIEYWTAWLEPMDNLIPATLVPGWISATFDLFSMVSQFQPFHGTLVNIDWWNPKEIRFLALILNAPEGKTWSVLSFLLLI